MSCKNAQELISLLLDGKVPAGDRESVLAHTGVCRECGTHLEALETQRARMLRMAQVPMPEALAMKLRVIASHERERQLARVSVRERVRRLAGNLNLAVDNLMRPVALPLTGGLLSALLLFGLLMPTLSFAHHTGDRDLSSITPLFSLRTFPVGRIVTNPYDEVADADEDFPRIEPVTSAPSDFLDVVDLTIDETGKVVDWNIVRGELTPDMESVIMFSRFEPATNMGMATEGQIRMVQFAPSETVHG